jgi:multimeric flavodoxin WrbA
MQLLEKKQKQKVKTVIKIGIPTKVLVLNSSPKRDKGNTSFILKPFIEGMKDKGADVEIINLYDMNIVPCIGEFYCWEVSPGNCAQKDDMQLLYPKIKKADFIVLAAPVYIGMVNAKMNPLVEPFMVPMQHMTQHQLRDGVKHANVVLISTCGHWEMENFENTVDYIDTFCKYFSYKFAGVLLRPHADIISKMLANGKDLDDISESARTAGEELIENGTVSKDLADIVSEELMSREEYIKNINDYFRVEIAKNKK